jgi:hypothetical protein
MIRVVRHEEVAPFHGAFRWAVPSLGLAGQSTEPLLEACRQLHRLGHSGKAAIYRAGKSGWDLRCDIAWGATHVIENGRFVPKRWRADRDNGDMAEAAE